MDNRRTINNYLGNRGLSTLDNPQGMVQQLGFLVEDDKHFMQMLNKCQPQYRHDMYEALRPHLRFVPRPLDVYIAELGMQAEIEQLPTVDNDGKFRAFRTPEIDALDVKRIEDVVEETLASKHLTVTCKRCTREETFHGGTRGDVIYKLRAAGWTWGVDPTGEGQEICPVCPVSRN
jgi:hypothetical protein